MGFAVLYHYRLACLPEVLRCAAVQAFRWNYSWMRTREGIEAHCRYIDLRGKETKRLPATYVSAGTRASLSLVHPPIGGRGWYRVSAYAPRAPGALRAVICRQRQRPPRSGKRQSPGWVLGSHAR